MKKSKSIIALVVILLLLCGAYFYVSKHPNTNTSNSSSADTATRTVPVWKVNNTKVSKIIITSNNGGITFNKNTKDWSIENYDYKLDQAAITSVTDSLINLFGTVIEKNAQDLEKYGLKKPTINVTIVGDTEDKILIVGDKSSDGKNYYASEKDKNSVYFISASNVERLTAPELAYRDKTITTIGPAVLTSMKIIQAGISPIEITRNTNQSEQEAQNNINSWIMTGPYSIPLGADDQIVSSVTDTIANLKATDIEIDNPVDLSVYGLDKPFFELILKDSKNTLHLFVGKNKDANTLYFKTSETNTIYIMDKTIIDTFRMKPFDVVVKFAYLVNIDYVDKIVVDANGHKDIISLSRNSVKAEKSGEPDVVTTISKVNGKAIELSKFKTQYQEIIGLTVDAENDKKLVDKPEVSITYSLNKGSMKQEVVSFSSYNDQFYAVIRDGKSDFVIAKDKVNKMITGLKNLK